MFCLVHCDTKQAALGVSDLSIDELGVWVAASSAFSLMATFSAVHLILPLSSKSSWGSGACPF